MAEQYGEFVMGPLKRVTGGRGHLDSGMTGTVEPTGSYAMKVALIGDKDGFEYIAGELVDGRRKTVVLSGTALEGWVLDAMHAYGSTVFLGSWVELGTRQGELYIELLMSSRDFDLVYAEKLLRERPAKYKAWKNLHRVPRTVDHEGELYYGRIEAALT